MKKNLTICFLWLVLTSPVSAQWADWEQIIAEESENSILQDFFDNPLDLNRASGEELSQLPWLSVQKAKEIVKVRKRLHGFQSWDDLIAEGLFSPSEIVFFQQILTLSPAGNTSIKIKGRHRISFRKEKTKGELQQRFYGNRYRTFNRFDFSVGDHFRTGFVMEKDPGEASLTDYVTGFLDIAIPHLQSRCLIGQFTLENGTGLHYNSPYQYGYSDQPIHNARPLYHRTRPFLGTSENQGYRGIALDIYSPIHITAILSQRKKAATLKNNQITSYYNSGYYRYATEKEKRNRVTEKIIGIVLSHRFKLFTLSTSFRQSSTSLPLLQKRNLEQIGTFSGSLRKSLSVYLQGPTCLPIFIEWVQTIGTGHAINAGCHWHQKSAEMILVYRRYDRGAISELGSGLSSRSENEKGIYWGVLWRPNKKIKLSTLFDASRNALPETRRPVLMPQTSWMGKIDYRLNSVWVLAGRYKRKSDFPLLSEIDRFGNKVKKSTIQTSHQWRLALDGKLTPAILWRTRIETHKTIQGQNETNAILMNQSFNLNFSFFRIILHWTLFDAPNYTNRFYHYSFTVPGSFALKTLYGKGAQAGLLLYLKPVAQCILTLAAIQTRYRDRSVHGSGLDEWQGELEHQVYLQMNWHI